MGLRHVYRVVSPHAKLICNQRALDVERCTTSRLADSRPFATVQERSHGLPKVSEIQPSVVVPKVAGTHTSTVVILPQKEDGLEFAEQSEDPTRLSIYSELPNIEQPLLAPPVEGLKIEESPGDDISASSLSLEAGSMGLGKSSRIRGSQRGSIDRAEPAKFAAIAATWWDRRRPCKPWHIMNPTRVSHINAVSCVHFRKNAGSAQPLEGLEIVDVGFGSRLACEPLARMGGQVTGVDAAMKNIGAASLHAAREPATSSINYHSTTVEQPVQDFGCSLSGGTSKDANREEGAGGSKSHDEIAEKYEKLLQKWSSNTPLLLEDLRVELNPIIMCRVLKKIPKSNVARKFFNWGKTQRGYHHNVYTYTALIDHYGRARNYSAIEQVVAEMREEGFGMNVVTFSSLIHWHRKANNLEGVRHVWRHMQKEGCKPNEVTYTTYIDALTKAGCHYEAMQVFGEMQDSGCRPNIFTYTVLIHSLIELKNLEGACEVFQKLGDLQCRPNSVTYSLLIRALVEGGDLEKSVFLFKDMMEARLTPSHALRSFLFEALRAEGRVTEAEELTQINAAMVAETERHLTDINAFRCSLPKPEKLAELLRNWGPDTERALERVRVQLKHPYLMNVVTLLKKEPEVAWRFFEWLKAQEGYKPTKYMFTKMLDIIGKAGHTQLQEELLLEAESASEANTISFNTLIKSYAETKHTDAALQVFERMKEQGFEPNTYTYTMLIDLLSRTRNHSQAMQMYGQMVKAKCKPSTHTYTVIIHSLARSGKVNAANTLFEKLPSLGCPPSTITYTILMQAFLKARELEKALKVYENMRAEGITPSRVTIKVLTRGLHAAGMHDEADALSTAGPYISGSVTGDDSPGIVRADKDVRDVVNKHFSSC